MPIYEYRCICGVERQLFSHTFSPSLPTCPQCQGTMRRRVSQPAGLLRPDRSVQLKDVPRSWDGLQQGSREATTHWRRELERRSKEYGVDAPATRGAPSLTCGSARAIPAVTAGQTR